MDLYELLTTGLKQIPSKSGRNKKTRTVYHKVIKIVQECRSGVLYSPPESIESYLVLTLACGCTKIRTLADCKLSPGQKVPIPKRATCINHPGNLT